MDMMKNMMTKTKLMIFIAATLFYTVIDLVWNFAIATPFIYNPLHASTGSDVNLRTMPELGFGGIIALLAFLLLIGYANTHFVIMPAIKARNVTKALMNSFLLGCTAYATYIVPVYATINNWPLILVPFDIIIGGLLSLATSGVITAAYLRWMQKPT